MTEINNYQRITSELNASGATLVAVSKTQPPGNILQLYQLGQRVFGENRVQEMLAKASHLPPDIQWHLIGHLQSNKVSHVIPVAAMIESVDSIKLLQLIQKEAATMNHVVPILLQIKISSDATKYGFSPSTIAEELAQADVNSMTAIQFCGVMGMASFVDDPSQVRHEFRHLKHLFHILKQDVFKHHHDFNQISMGMSGDYQIAIEEGSTMVRIGSLLFSQRL